MLHRKTSSRLRNNVFIACFFEGVFFTFILMMFVFLVAPVDSFAAQGGGYYYSKGQGGGGGYYYSKGNGNGNGYYYNGNGYRNGNGLDEPIVLKSVAILPFENLSGISLASEIMMDNITHELKSKGWLLIAWKDAVEGFLAKRRVRYTGAITRLLVREMGKVLGVDAVMVGSVNYFSRSRGDIVVGLSCRLVSTLNGSIIWADNLTYTGRDFEGILGLGAVKSIDILSAMLVKDLVRSIEDKFFIRETALSPFEIERVITYPPVGKAGERIDLRVKILPILDEPKQVRVVINGVEIVLEKVGVGEYKGFFSAPESEGVYFLDVIAMDRFMVPFPFEAAGKLIVDSTPPPVEITISNNVFSISKRGHVIFDVKLLGIDDVDEWRMHIFNSDGEVVRSDRGYGKVPEKLRWWGEDNKRGRVGDGKYTCQFVVTDTAGNQTLISEVITVKSKPPKVDVDVDVVGDMLIFSFDYRPEELIDGWSLTLRDKEDNVIKKIEGEGAIPKELEYPVEEGISLVRVSYSISVKDVAGNEFRMVKILPSSVARKLPFARLKSSGQSLADF